MTEKYDYCRGKYGHRRKVTQPNPGKVFSRENDRIQNLRKFLEQTSCYLTILSYIVRYIIWKAISLQVRIHGFYIPCSSAFLTYSLPLCSLLQCVLGIAH